VVHASVRIPSDSATEDVLKARLKTVGVVEHRFAISMGTMRGSTNWVIYDVGGARNQRQAWAPFFQDGEFILALYVILSSPSSEVNAVIFLAPISAFDQVLAEVRSCPRRASANYRA
jgi:guanine nucleotide-binding protein alpha-1 subunit